MKNTLIIQAGKAVSYTIQHLNLGHGSTWPGHLALMANKDFIGQIITNSRLKVIMIAGTNGKTTTSLMIRKVLEDSGKRVIHNESGANLLNGIASTLLLNSNSKGEIKADYAIFEVDENSLPLILKEISPAYLVLLNLFRDQLDRYGEVDTIARNWQAALKDLHPETVVISNADDPRTAYLGMQRKNSRFFGLTEKSGNKKSLDHAVDSVYCPKCGTKLQYSLIFYSHLGKWQCPECHLKRPHTSISEDIQMNLSGTYNLSNAHGIIVLARELSTPEGAIANSLKTFSPAFGRQEKIIVNGKSTQLFLSKNPTGFNESLRTINELEAKHVFFVLNDRIADGKDVSWIWDIDMEPFLQHFENITVSGDRTYDMALRIKYASNEQMANGKWRIEENLQLALENALKKLPNDKTLYILPTYTAMLEVRKLLTGKKIL